MRDICGHSHLFKPVRTLSVVIPSLNESENISFALNSLMNERSPIEFIVADGGSVDDTREIAAKFGAHVVESEKGRGLQIDAGLQKCTGDIVLILHADCRILPGAIDRIFDVLNKNPGCIGGSLGMRYEADGSKYRLLALINNGRAICTGISFGDQGQFFRLEALNMIGGFPRQMLMEDVEFSVRLKKEGEICHVPKGIVVSSRRWENKGFWRNFTYCSFLFMAYLIKRRFVTGDPLMEEFYRRYYKSNEVSDI